MNADGLCPILEWCRLTNKKQRQRNTLTPAFILYNHGALLRLFTIMNIRFYSSMLKLTVLVISLLTLSNVQSSNGYPRKEFPFCPGAARLAGWTILITSEIKIVPDDTNGNSHLISILITHEQLPTRQSIMDECLTIFHRETVQLSSNNEFKLINFRYKAYTPAV